jgi:hypothetical protein
VVVTFYIGKQVAFTGLARQQCFRLFYGYVLSEINAWFGFTIFHQ